MAHTRRAGRAWRARRTSGRALSGLETVPWYQTPRKERRQQRTTQLPAPQTLQRRDCVSGERRWCNAHSRVDSGGLVTERAVGCEANIRDSCFGVRIRLIFTSLRMAHPSTHRYIQGGDIWRWWPNFKPYFL